VTNDTGAGPYQQAASLYRSAGWEGVLPLPPGLKHPPPAGWTGWGGPMPSHPDVQAWLDSPEAAGNIALRPPRGVLGIDADTYKPAGAATVRALEARLGPLPATWISSARTDGSGIRWYRVPDDVPGWHSKAGEGVELVHFGHRYAVVWPSTNPDAAGALYLWFAPSGAHAMVADYPSPQNLPELPAAWVEELRGPAPGEKAHLADGEALAWLERVRDGEMCAPVAAVLQRAAEAFASHASRYDTMRDTMRAVVGFGAEGHAGTAEALFRLRTTYWEVTADERRDTVGEWDRALRGAIELEAAKRPGGPDPLCVCAGEPGFLPAHFFAAPSVADPADGAEEVNLESVLNADLEDRLDAAFALARALASRPVLEQAKAWETLKGSGLPITELKRALRDEVKALERREKERRREEHAAEVAAGLEKARGEGELLPAPHDPMAAARELVRRYVPFSGEPPIAHLCRWRGDGYLWNGVKWIYAPDDEFRDLIYHWTEHAVFSTEDGPQPWQPNIGKVNAVTDAMNALLRRPAAAEDDRGIVCLNGTLELATGELLPHTPHRFNLNALPYAYEAGATAPRWLEFLESVLPGDPQAHRLLQEWFGYVIGGQTDQQKMLSLVGPKRCGKGTVNRILQALLGPEAVSSPSIDKLGGQFGEAGLIGKKLAVMSDVRWQGRNAADAIPVLLAIVGEDSRDVPRKNREDWHGYLGARFMCMSNDAPEFRDASGALAGRMLHIEFTESFYGREDITLTRRLLLELPGILNWALEGLGRLNARGVFLEPDSAAQLREEVEEASQPERAFLDSGWVTLEEGACTPMSEVLEAYVKWCHSKKRTLAAENITESSLSRRLKSAEPRFKTGRRMEAGTRSTYVYGMRVTAPKIIPGAFPVPGVWASASRN
jgi:putative DNA primase/helicase